MTLRSAQKILICRTALALAAVLLHGATAFSAEAADGGGHAQARALLSAAPETRTEQASTVLPTVCLEAFTVDAQDQARSLLAQSASCAEMRIDGSDGGVTGAASAANPDTALSGAQDSARKMILGRGA
jgi:hypothetical protein